MGAGGALMFGLNPTILLAIGAAVVTALMLTAIRFMVYSAYESGKADARADQAIIDREVYDKIVKGINNGQVDTSDERAVDCFLHSIAGTKPKGYDCGDLLGD